MSKQLYNLEHAFGFEDAAFGQYMSVGSAHASPGRLMELSAQMDPSTHPIVRYAAGCAAAEVAMSRIRPSDLGRRGAGPYPLAARLEALAVAQTHWQGLGAIFAEHQEAATDPHRAADFWRFGMKSQQALAYLPSTELVANWLSGQEPDPDYLEANLQRTAEGLINIGGAVLKIAAGKPNFKKESSGLGYEITTGLLLQKPRPLRHIVVSASIRQSNLAGRTSHLVAVSAKESHAKTMVQVVGYKENGHPSTISARPDLLLGPQYAPIETLKVLVHGGTDPVISARLHEMSETLADRIETTAA